MGEKPLVGKLFRDLPRVVVHPAEYHFGEHSDLSGPFRGHIGGGKVFIKYDKNGATIIGKTDKFHLFTEFEGVTKVLGDE